MKKKDQFQSLSITEIINFETGSHLNNRPSLIQRFDSQNANESQTLLRSARNNFYTTIQLIRDRTSSNRLVLVRSEVLGQLVNTLTADYEHSS